MYYLTQHFDETIGVWFYGLWFLGHSTRKNPIKPRLVLTCDSSKLSGLYYANSWV